MARVRFTQDFDYKPTPQVTIAYEAGWEGTVKRECADQAVAAGKAEWAGKDVEAKQDGEAEISR
ncbi:hypothetical protein [Agrobacterium tumefaciens]|uniref:hypothetical protein n=1 Tax=Agrobacterium tumefaciens TaxID=358 RepID=UPI0021CE3319|nr:hypothetical protein [Agrobacterium tumefaciens]UXS49279.1 hypothetical protein FY149_18820 [Agrobacterium tumefaciens]